MKLRKILYFIFCGGLIKTLLFNFKVFSFSKAIRLPVIIGPKVKMKGLRRGCFECGSKRGLIRIAMSDGSFNLHVNQKSYLSFGKNGKIICHGKAIFYSTFRINVTGILEIGDDFSSNTGFLISCGEHISFGNSCLLG